jgi:DMSO reductase anchor subunit
MVPARPSWNTRYTLAEFYSTAILLGALLVLVMSPMEPWINWVAAAGAALQLLTQALKFLAMSQSEVFELRASSLLLSGIARKPFLLRLGLLVALIALPLTTASVAVNAAALALALGGEILGRWLFFVTVVPKNIAAAFTTGGRAA